MQEICVVWCSVTSRIKGVEERVEGVRRVIERVRVRVKHRQADRHTDRRREGQINKD